MKRILYSAAVFLWGISTLTLFSPSANAAPVGTIIRIDIPQENALITSPYAIPFSGEASVPYEDPSQRTVDLLVDNIVVKSNIAIDSNGNWGTTISLPDESGQKQAYIRFSDDHDIASTLRTFTLNLDGDRDDDGLPNDHDNNPDIKIAIPEISIPLENATITRSQGVATVISSGTGDPNTEVDIFLNDIEVASNVPVDASGNWGKTFLTSQTGTLILKVCPGYDGYNASLDRCSQDRTLDIPDDDDGDDDGLPDDDDNDPENPIAIPVINIPTQNSTFTSSTITTSGTADPNTEVDLFIDGNEVASDVPVDASGNWGATLTVATEGTHVLKACPGYNGLNADPARCSGERTFTINLSDDRDGDGLPNDNDNDPDTPIAAPIINAPAEGAEITDTNNVPVSGTGEANTEVDILLNGSEVATNIPVDGNGDWSTTLSALTDDNYTVEARAGYNDANSNVYSDPVHFTLNADDDDDDDGLPDDEDNDPNNPIAIPVITIPTADQVFATNQISFSGTGEANTEVDLLIFEATGAPVTTFENVPVDANGDWSTTQTISTDGDYTVKARAGYNGADSTQISDARRFLIDTSGVGDGDGDGLPDDNDNDPNVPITAPVIQVPAENEIVETLVVTISGTGELTTEVDLFIDGNEEISNLPVDANGDWTTTFTFATEGIYQIQARAGYNDADSNVFSPSRSFEINTTEDRDGDGLPNDNDNDPDTKILKPVISSPSENQLFTEGPIPVAGAGDPNTEIDLLLNGSEVATNIPVNGDGDWTTSLTLTTDGTYELIARAGYNGADSNVESDVRTFVLDADGDGDDDGLPDDNDNNPTDPIDAPIITTPTEDQIFTDRTITFVGTGEINTEVDLFINGDETSSDIIVNGNGDWSVDITFTTDGMFAVQARAGYNGANSNRYSDPVPFSIDTSGNDDDGDGLLNGEDNDRDIVIATPTVITPLENDVLDSQTVLFTGNGEANTEVDLFLNGNEVASDIPVNGDGNWALTYNTGLDASYTLTVRAGYNGANSIIVSDPRNFEVDTSGDGDRDDDGLPDDNDNDPDNPIATPIITTPAEGETLDSKEVIFTGTGDANTEVDLFLDGIEVFSNLIVDGNGDWSYTYTVSTDKEYVLTVRAGYNGDNSNRVSDPRTFTVDTDDDGDGDGLPDDNDNNPEEPIATPVINTPTQGAFLQSKTVLISGTGDPNTEVDFLINGTEIVSNIPVNGNGQWAASVDLQTDGTKTLIVRAGYNGDNSNVLSAPRNFSIDSSGSGGDDGSLTAQSGGYGNGSSGFRWSGMRRDEYVGSGKFWTKEQLNEFMAKIDAGTPGKVKTYVNRNGYLVFAGYQSGRMGVHRFKDRFQNKVIYRGDRKVRYQTSRGVLRQPNELTRTATGQSQKFCFVPTKEDLDIFFGGQFRGVLRAGAQVCVNQQFNEHPLAYRISDDILRSMGRTRPETKKSFAERYYEAKAKYQYDPRRRDDDIAYSFPTERIGKFNTRDDIRAVLWAREVKKNKVNPYRVEPRARLEENTSRINYENEVEIPRTIKSYRRTYRTYDRKRAIMTPGYVSRMQRQQSRHMPPARDNRRRRGTDKPVFIGDYQ